MVVGQVGIFVHWYQPIRIHGTAIVELFRLSLKRISSKGYRYIPDRLLSSSFKQIVTRFQFFLSLNYPGLISFVFQLLEAFLEEALV